MGRSSCKSAFFASSVCEFFDRGSLAQCGRRRKPPPNVHSFCRPTIKLCAWQPRGSSRTLVADQPSSDICSAVALVSVHIRDWCAHFGANFRMTIATYSKPLGPHWFLPGAPPIRSHCPRCGTQEFIKFLTCGLRSRSVGPRSWWFACCRPTIEQYLPHALCLLCPLSL